MFIKAEQPKNKVKDNFSKKSINVKRTSFKIRINNNNNKESTKNIIILERTTFILLNLRYYRILQKHEDKLCAITKKYNIIAIRQRIHPERYIEVSKKDRSDNKLHFKRQKHLHRVLKNRICTNSIFIVN